MYTTINEPVAVTVSFSFHTVKPISFLWSGKKFVIEKVNLVHRTRQGRALIHYFSVSDQVNYFKLAFNSETLQWKLEEMMIGAN